MQPQTKSFAGVLTAIVTPFREDDTLDLDAFGKLIEKQIAGGVDGIVVCGSTGEGIALTDEERFALVKKCVEQVRGRVSVVAGAGSSNTKVACALQKQMKDLGADATLQVTPWYNKPTPEGLYRHFRQIAETNDLPIILYNVPSRTCCDMTAQTILRLAKDCPTVVGLKDSNVETVRVQSLLGELKKIRPDFTFLSGEDGFVLPLLAMGGHGVISVVSNVVPQVMADMIKHFKQGNLAEAQTIATRLAQLVPLMFFRTNPIPVKSAVHLMGHIKNEFRLPLYPLNDEDMRYLQSQLREGGWL